MIILFSFLSYSTSAQTPDWIWAKSARGVGDDYGRIVDLDSTGNVYVLGTLSSPIITFNTTTLTKISFGNDFFIVKYDKNGNILWAKNAGVPETNHNMSSCRGESMTVDGNGNCIITGTFYGDSMIFDKTTLINSHTDIYNVFVVKYDTNGDVVWANYAEKTSGASGTSISSDSKANSYLIGYFQSDSILFGSSIVKGLPPANGDHGGNFMVKYNPEGNVLWAHILGGMHRDQIYSISVDPFGNSYICGYMQGPSTSFGNITLENAAFLGGIFIVKYDPAGNALWAKTAEETGWGGAQCNSICADNNGNFYLTGYFNSSAITFGTTTLLNTYTASSHSPFYSKFDSDGNLLWVKTAGSPYITSDKTLSFDTNGNSYLTSNNVDDRVDFVDKFDAAGNLIWYVRGYWGMSSSSICVDTVGNAFITGYFTGAQAFFGSTTLNNAVTNGNSEELFIAKLSNLVTGLSEKSSSSGLINLYPSQTSDKITIENSADIEIGNISIYSTNGELLLNKSFPRGKSEFDISSFATGFYIVRLVTEKEIISKKVVKD